ncbi:MAG: DNA double-strand break repair nuclease NurA [Promethearchaeota archaeon]
MQEIYNDKAELDDINGKRYFKKSGKGRSAENRNKNIQKTLDYSLYPARYHKNFGRLSNKMKKQYNDYSKIEALESHRKLEHIISNLIPDIAHDIFELAELKKKFIASLLPIKKARYPFFDDINKEYNIENPIIEPCLSYPVKMKSPKNLTIVAVDGSIVKKSFYGLELGLIRAIGVIYKFDEKGIPKVEYYPDPKGMDNYKLAKMFKNLSDDESSIRFSIEQTLMEISVVKQIIEYYREKRKRATRSKKKTRKTQNSNKIKNTSRPKNPPKSKGHSNTYNTISKEETDEKIDIIILDGSILAEPLNMIFNQNIETLEKYSELLALYKDVYELCETEGINLVGVVKDTKSSTFRKIFSKFLPFLIRKNHNLLYPLLKINYKKILEYFSDLDFFNYLLKGGERSCSFSISSPANSWMARQFELLDENKDELVPRENTSKIANNILKNFKFYAVFLKAVPLDLPLKLEFYVYNSEDTIEPQQISKKIDDIASVIYYLSSKFEDFALPFPQIEAHMRARLSKEDMNRIMRILEQQIVIEQNKYMDKKLRLLNLKSKTSAIINDEQNNIDNINEDLNSVFSLIWKHASGYPIQKRRERLPF